MEKRVIVYQATHKQVCKKENDYMIPIQTGASLTKKRIADLTDNTKIHISDKNKIYCELTALYWGWKNGNSRIWGLCHYRRKFSFRNRQEIEKILQRYDWIVPIHYCFRNTLEREYQKVHRKEDLELLKEVLKQKKDGSYEAVLEVLSSNKLYPYNMLIAAREEMEFYCEWLFDILFRIEQERGEREDSFYQQRYIGFLAERLMTAYIWKNHLKVYEDNLIYEEKGYSRKREIHSRINNKIFLLKRFGEERWCCSNSHFQKREEQG